MVFSDGDAEADRHRRNKHPRKHLLLQCMPLYCTPLPLRKSAYQEILGGDVERPFRLVVVEIVVRGNL